VEYYDQVQAAVAAVRAATRTEPRVGVVLGSGLGAFAERISGRTLLPYGEIPGFPTSGVAGHKGELVLGELGGVPVAVMSGRVHFYEGYSMKEVTLPMRVLAGLGVGAVVITNAAGAVNPTYVPGDFMVIVDHINMTGQNPLIGHNDDRLGPRFPDMTRAYGPAGREALHATAREIEITLREGVYVGLAGPSYETPAEIRMLQRLGGDAVGMSTVPEVIVAQHAGLRVAGLSVITNRAAGLSAEPLSHEEVKEVGNRVEGVLCDLLAGAVVRLG
jgi:purine-nucleoside phosphorylase